MKNRFLNSVLLAITLTVSFANAKTYVLKKGDTLASVARSQYGEPVFGPKGSINKIYQLNPSLKNKPNLVEPGLEIKIEGKALAKEIVAEAPMPTLPPPPPAAEEVAPVIAEQAAAAPVAEEIAPTPSPTPMPEIVAAPVLPVQPPPAPAPQALKHENEKGMHAHFAIIPTYSQIKINSVHENSGNVFDLNSNATAGVTGIWEQHWKESFSTLLSVDYKQFKSTSVSDVTTTTVLESTNLTQYEFALLNDLCPSFKMGLGISQGRDIFIETDATTLIPTAVISTATSPFFMADWTLIDWSGSKIKALGKITWKGAEAGGSHTVKKGTATLAGLVYEQKVGEDLAVNFGYKYETNDQSLLGMTQKRTDSTFELGLIF